MKFAKKFDVLEWRLIAIAISKVKTGVLPNPDDRRRLQAIALEIASETGSTTRKETGVSNDNIHTLPGVGKPAQLGQPNPALVAVLENLLARAKSGELQSFIGTGFTSDGSRAACWGGYHPDVYQMLGAINWLEHEYVARQTQTIQE